MLPGATHAFLALSNWNFALSWVYDGRHIFLRDLSQRDVDPTCRSCRGRVVVDVFILGVSTAFGSAGGLQVLSALWPRVDDDLPCSLGAYTSSVHSSTLDHLCLAHACDLAEIVSNYRLWLSQLRVIIGGMRPLYRFLLLFKLILVSNTLNAIVMQIESFIKWLLPLIHWNLVHTLCWAILS